MKKILFLAASLIVLSCSKEEDGETISPAEPSAGEEIPVAVDDEVSTAENTSLKISGILDNDTVFDYARITDFDTNSAEGGTIEDNRDGTLTYTPSQDYIGNDSFDYTICDNAGTPNCSTATVKIAVTAASPVAEDDSYETTEGKSLSILNYLANDELLDNAKVTSIDTEGATGSAILQSNGSIEYSPAEGFSGEDVFTYTICDDDETPTCATAIITILVIDEGSPIATNDNVVLEAGTTEIILSDLLKNDNLIDEADISSVDFSESQGTVILNADGSVTYKASPGFVGNDSFTYTLCDDDRPNATCGTATVTVQIVQTVSFNIPASLDDYYEDAVFTENSDLLYQELADLSAEQHVNRLEYYMRHDYLYDADADLTNPELVVLMYTGERRPWQEYQQGDLSEGETFNTEHIFPQSKLASEEAKNDMHHMRVADVVINETRLNYPFTTGSGAAKLVNGNSWYPGDEWKGDVARMVMYVHVRYGEPFSDVGTLNMFLQWNAEDPVSAFELQRQEIIEGAQGNRNPFIDNPYLATLIWQGTPAENRWE